MNTYAYAKTCMQMFTAVLFVTVKKLEKTHMFFRELMNELWYTHTMKHHSAIKKGNLLVHTISWWISRVVC